MDEACAEQAHAPRGCCAAPQARARSRRGGAVEARETTDGGTRRAGNDRRICSAPAAASRRCLRLSAFQAPMASRAREFPGESSCSVFVRGSPGNLLDSGQEVTLVPLTPITAVARYWPVMDIVPPPGEDQAPRLQAFRAEHPGYRDRQPRRLAHGHVVGLPGRHDPGGHIRPAPAARPP
jgi:hypothetical protein